MTNFKSALSSLLVLLMFLTATHICAQKHDYVWLFGYSTQDNPKDSVFGTSMLDFNEYGSDNFIQFLGKSKMDFDATCSSISDAEGNYLFSYNGKYIEDASFQPMQNGLDLSESGDEDGDLFPQQSLILPLPGSKSKYVLFHQTWKYIDQLISIAGFRLYYSVIDMEANNGLGAVVERKNLLIQDTADIGKIAATKHANGRDWWVIYPEYNSKNYQRMLLTPSGIEIMPKIRTGMRHREGLGQAHFSPDGTKYAKFSAINEREGDFLYI